MNRITATARTDVIPVLLSLEIGKFQYRTTAEQALSFTLQNTPNLTSISREKIRELYKKTRIDAKHLATPDFQQDKETILGQGLCQAPLDARLGHAGSAVLPLVTEVAKRALFEAKVRAEDVGQIVVVSSTAFGSPGLEGKLVRCLGLQPNVLRACVNYMGCGAGILGLRWASDFVKGLDGDRRNCVSLLVCVEASSFHYNNVDDQNSLITHSLFSDGVACAVVAARSPYAVGVSGKLAILDFESFMMEGAEDGICLRMNTQSIECLLSPRLPEAIKSGVRLWLNSLLQRHGATQEKLSFWAIHPGGPKIIEKVLQGLSLPEEAARFSWETLREYGNTLSCGVFYVLRGMLDDNAIKPGDQGLAFSFSPGVGVEGVLLHALPIPANRPLRERLQVKERRGAVIPSWVPDQLINRVGELDQRPDDVFVVTYPKAGTTWMLQVVHLLRNGGDQGILLLNRAVAWIERDGIDGLKAMPSPRIIKTHLPLSLLTPTKGRWIYVARNPKDLAVSYYYHARAKIDFDFLGTWDQFFELFLNGQVEGGDWWEHAATGIALARQRPEYILFVWYEEMRNVPLLTIRRIASFLGTDTDPSFLQEVARKSSLDYMQRSPLTNVRWTEERYGEAPHLRKGSVGGWRELFSPEQEVVLENKWWELAANFGVIIPTTLSDLTSSMELRTST